MPVINMDSISVVQGDITTLQVEAIVNAANRSLLGGGGVDGAIHSAAGPKLLAECLTLNGCETGQAKLTGAYRLPVKYVVHTVGPVWQGGGHGEAELLTACYRNSLQLALQHKMQSIAFPCISTGIYGYPPQQAAQIAVSEVDNFLRQQAVDMQVIFCCFSQADFDIYQRLLAA